MATGSPLNRRFLVGGIGRALDQSFDEHDQRSTTIK
jgi:hypothetical protein